ncbi:flavoprotein [Nocardia sp. NPDC055053]
MVTKSPVLHAIVTGAPPAGGVGALVSAAQADGWRVGVIATASALPFLDIEALTAMTGYPVPHTFRSVGEPEPLPPADAVILAPATANTIAKLATGVSDTLATGRCAQAIGAGVPLVVVPFSTRDHLAHPAIAIAMSSLRAWGVTVLFGEQVCPLPAGGPTSGAAEAFPWRLAWDRVRAEYEKPDNDQRKTTP